MGFFSPGPPPLQVYQATAFIFMIGWFCFSAIMASFLVLLLRMREKPGSQIVGFIYMAVAVAEAAMIWYTVCYDSRRAPGYDWGQGKLRMD